MSITDELRRVAAKTECANGRCEKLYRGDLDHIADRIDAEHEAKVSYWQEASYKDGYDEGFASADDWLAQHEDAIAEHGWIRLPKDADGEYIHIGDKVTCATSVWEVTGFRLTSGFWGICCTVFNDQGGSGTNVYPPSDLHHYQQPTVEDVLREFAEKITDSQIPDVHPTYEEAIAEYAAKLQLREVDE